MSDSKKNLALSRFRVIEGGLSPVPAAPQKSTWKHKATDRLVQSTDGSPAEKERLRRAILALQLKDTGITVEQALDEMSERWEEETNAALSRLAVLGSRMDDLGLMVHTVDPDLELARNCFAQLHQPHKLLAKHPELHLLEPERHLQLEIG